VPLDLVFEDEQGKKVELREYFQKDRPVVLQLGYFECPMLCSLVSKGLIKSLNALSLEPGKDFAVLSVSFDPSETSKLAYLKKKSYLQEYDRLGAAAGLRLLVGDAKNIRRLTEAVGFKYKWVESARQFSHPAALMVLTPEGKVSRYLYGLDFPPTTLRLRLSLVEASAGKVGTTTDQFLLVCLHYDPATGKYSIAAMNLMRLAGVVTVLVVAGLVWRLFRKGSRVASGTAAGN
jgi:protein SCO1/2